jgi:hypothetical protein
MLWLTRLKVLAASGVVGIPEIWSTSGVSTGGCMNRSMSHSIPAYPSLQPSAIASLAASATSSSTAVSRKNC